MNRLFSTLALLVCFISANAQTVIKGTLVDSLTHEGEPYATIRISKDNKEDKPIVMAVTDLDGHFSQEIKSSGNYVIAFSSVGRTAVKRNFSVNGETEIDLGTILIHDDENTLSGVEIVAQKPLVKMEADKMTYSVEDDVDSKSMTVLDMLRKVPMVTVDGQDNITVNGSSSFKIYVDGKPNAMLSNNASTILKAMPASSVSSIEVVTNPGAKYDAEGAGGILDIKMAKANSGSDKESMNGYNGSLSVDGGNRGWGTGVYIAGQQGKFSYNARMNYDYSNNGDVEVEMIREQKDGSTTNYTQTSKNTAPVVFGNIALGYEIDSLSSVNASLGVMTFDVKNNGDPTTKLYGGVYGNGFSYGSHMWTKTGEHSFNGSLDYQHFFNADKTSSITLTYQLNTEPGTNKSETSFDVPKTMSSLINLTDNSSNGKTNTLENIVQLDIVSKLSAVSTFNYGLKYANRRNTSDTDYFLAGVYNEDNSTDYNHTDQIGAVYAESENHWEKWSAKGGLRYEQTWQKVKFNQGNGSDFTKKYGNLVPSASISRTLSMGKNIGLTYNMRIARPGITYLNPYVDRSEPTSISYGNTAIIAEKSHNIGLVYNSYSQKLMWSATLKQTFDRGGIEQYSFFKGNIMNTTYGNIVNRRVTSLSIFASWSMTKSTRVTFDGDGSYNDFRSKELDKNTYGWMGDVMLSVQQTLPKDWNVSMMAMTSTKRLTLQGNSSPFNIGVISASKDLFNERLNISGNFVTGLSKGGNLHLDTFSEGSDFTSNMKITVPLTRFSISAKWTFGNTKKQFQKHESKVQSDYIEHKSSSENISSAGQM